MAEPKPTWADEADEQRAFLRAWKLIFRAYQEVNMIALKDALSYLRSQMDSTTRKDLAQWEGEYWRKKWGV